MVPFDSGFVRRALIATAFALSLLPLAAQAIVGAPQPSSRAASVVMILHRAGLRASFCSGTVIGARTVLTAAHCVGSAEATRVHFRDLSGAPVLMPVVRVARHPGYRTDAIAARAKSVDLAIVETHDPLPSAFTPASIASASDTPGAAFTIAGFGVSQMGQAATSGVLREARVTLREPVSSLLLWLDGAGAGACTGDSGGPVFDAAGALVGVIAFAQGATGRGCGGLTQAVRVAPFRAWFEAVGNRQ
jgi:secreted trypsin-like serine protease